MEGGAGYNFERELHKDYSCQNLFILGKWFQMRRFECDILFKKIPNMMKNILGVHGKTSNLALHA